MGNQTVTSLWSWVSAAVRFAPAPREPVSCQDRRVCTSHCRRRQPGTPCGLGVLMGPDVWVTRATGHLQPHSVVVVGRGAAKVALCGHVPGTTTRPAPDVTGWKDLSPRLAEATVGVQVEPGGQEAGRGSRCPTLSPWATPLSPAVSHRSTMGQDRKVAL